MVKDADAHAEEDKRRRDEAEVRNTADSLVYQTEKLLKDQGEGFTGTEREQVEANLKALKEALEGADVESIRRATEVLATSSQELGRKLYEQASAQTGDGATSEASQPQDDEVVDAEIVDDES